MHAKPLSCVVSVAVQLLAGSCNHALNEYSSLLWTLTWQFVCSSFWRTPSVCNVPGWWCSSHCCCNITTTSNKPLLLNSFFCCCKLSVQSVFVEPRWPKVSCFPLLSLPSLRSQHLEGREKTQHARHQTTYHWLTECQAIPLLCSSSNLTLSNWLFLEWFSFPFLLFVLRAPESLVRRSWPSIFSAVWLIGHFALSPIYFDHQSILSLSLGWIPFFCDWSSSTFHQPLRN